MKEKLPMYDGETEIHWLERFIFVQECNIKALRSELIMALKEKIPKEEVVIR